MSANAKERPILFSGPMIRAILSGQKTQTRRAIAPRHPISFLGGKGSEGDPGEWGYAFDGSLHHGYAVLGRGFDEQHDHGRVSIPCPYGEPGDRLWVRETWAPLGDLLTEVIGRPRVFRADADLVRDDSGDRVGWWLGETFLEGAERPFRWRPALYMPRWASRITLEVVSVRVERLQDITALDAINEVGPGPVERFVWLWDSLNAKRGFGWDANPWVWRIEFLVELEARIANAERILAGMEGS